MASSRGRSMMTERRERRTFVFGSSTPRDLSYMNKVPPTLRAYDSKPTKTPQPKEEQTLTHYMRQARSLTPHLSGSRDGSCDRMRTSFAFGSSTPRQFSHLSGIQPELRVYDVKIRPKVDKRSYTTPLISSIRSRTVPATARAPQALPPKPDKVKRRTEDDDNEIASEPDFVQDRDQDRQADFMQSIKKQLHADQSAKRRQHMREKAISSSANGKTKVREERRVIRTTTNEGGKKVQKVVESVERSFPKRGSMVEDEAVELPVETNQSCIVPQSIISTAASELFAKSSPTVRPLNDSNEVVVVYEEKTPEGHLGGFLGDLAAKASELEDVMADQTTKVKDEMVNQEEKVVTKATADNEQQVAGERDVKNHLNDSGANRFSEDIDNAEEKLEVHSSSNAPPDDQHGDRKYSFEGTDKFGQLDVSNKAPSREGSELSIGYSPQHTSPEPKAKLVLDTEMKTSSDFQHSPEQHVEDLKRSSEEPPTYSEAAYLISEGTHLSERNDRPHYESPHSSGGGISSTQEDMRISEDFTRSTDEGILSGADTHSMHESIHLSEDIRSNQDDIPPPPPEADCMQESVYSTNGVRSFHESAHSPQKDILSTQHSIHSTEGARDARTSDDVSRPPDDSIHSTGEEVHSQHHSLHSDGDTHSPLPEKESFHKVERSSEHESYAEVISTLMEHPGSQPSKQNIHSPDESHIEQSSPGYILKSECHSERRSPDEGSYFVQGLRYEMSESRADTDESPADESRAYCLTSGSKSSEEATRIDDASLKEGDEEDMEEEAEDVSAI